jgi:hypothetical protein
MLEIRMPQAGMLGRLPFDPERPRLALEKYLNPRSPLARSGLPAVPLTADVDRASHVASWPMYANDQLGCCTIAAAAHMFGAWTAYNGLAAGEALFDDGEIVQAYSAVGGYVPGDPGTDNGAMMSDVLAYLTRTGLTDVTGKVHKVAGYAAFGNPADDELLGQVVDVFGGVYVGFNVQQHMMSQFEAGQVWTWRPGDAVIGGHCVPLQRREPAGSRHGILDYVTWAELQHADFGWQANAVEEAWAVVTQDWLDSIGYSVTGLDLSQLLADMAYV